MYLLQCDGCGATAFAETLADPDPLVVCKPGKGCCAIDHHHGQAAECSGDHGDCPEPGSCTLWGAVKAHHELNGTEAPESCPGGHCHRDIDGCNVCRSITITGIGGSASISPVGSAA